MEVLLLLIPVIIAHFRGELVWDYKRKQFTLKEFIEEEDYE
ncbi:MAG: hypothetical protein ACQEQD_04490 [Bacillota bacterium]